MPKKSVYQTPPTAAAVKRFVRQTHLEHPEYVIDYQTALSIFKQFRKNVHCSQVHIKVHTINTFFNTRIIDTFGFATRLSRIRQLDARIQSGDPGIIETIARYRSKKGKIIHFYSFATKYCHCHRPDKLPIYDRFVYKSLAEFNRKAGKFSAFTKDEIGSDYILFKHVMRDFIRHFGLQDLNAAQIDRFLWKLGKDASKKKTKRKSPKTAGAAF